MTMPNPYLGLVVTPILVWPLLSSWLHPSPILDTTSISGPGLPRIVFQPHAWSNPGIPDLSPSLDETPNLVRPLLDL